MTLDEALQELSECVGRIGRFPPDARLDRDRYVRAQEALLSVEYFVTATRALADVAPCGHAYKLWRPLEGTAAGALLFHRDPRAHGVCVVCEAVAARKEADARMADSFYEGTPPQTVAMAIRAQVSP